MSRAAPFEGGGSGRSDAAGPRRQECRLYRLRRFEGGGSAAEAMPQVEDGRSAVSTGLRRFESGGSEAEAMPQVQDGRSAVATSCADLKAAGRRQKRCHRSKTAGVPSLQAAPI
ncbi:MAG: hypothetical protein R3F11_32770 [Verrucomicrobiales bacterium]